jgi:serine protease inhibitor
MFNKLKYFLFILAMFISFNIHPAMAEINNISDANNKFAFELYSRLIQDKN